MRGARCRPRIKTSPVACIARPSVCPPADLQRTRCLRLVTASQAAAAPRRATAVCKTSFSLAGQGVCLSLRRAPRPALGGLLGGYGVNWRVGSDRVRTIATGRTVPARSEKRYFQVMAVPLACDSMAAAGDCCAAFRGEEASPSSHHGRACGPDAQGPGGQKKRRTTFSSSVMVTARKSETASATKMGH